MDQTPKKIIGCEFSRFLCNSLTQSSAGKVKIYHRSGIDFPQLIESAIGENVRDFQSCGSELFICNCKCYKKLQRLEKAKKSLDSIKQEICSTYQAINRRVKRQRADQIVDGNIAPSKRTSVAKSLKFNSVPATATSTTSLLATTCTSYNRPAVFLGNPVAWASPQYAGDQLLRQAFVPLITSTPASQQKTRKPSRVTETPSEVAVKISVNYPSKPVNKVLSKEYEALGKALVHGPPSRIATAVMKRAPLTHLVMEKVLRLLKTEVGDLCSKKKPSLLRNCTKEGWTTFAFEELCQE